MNDTTHRTTARLTPATWPILMWIKARTGETFGAIIERLVKADQERIEQEEPGARS